MWRLLVMLAGGCYAATAPSGVPCDPAAPSCPRGQVCLANTCQPDGTQLVLDAPVVEDAVTALRGCPADPDLALCLSFDMPSFTSPLANEGTLPVGASFMDVTRTALGAGGAAVFASTSTMQFEASPLIVGIVAIEATVRLDGAIAPMTRVGIVDSEAAASGMSMFVFAGTTTPHRIRCNLGIDDVYADTTLALGAWTTLACTCEGNKTIVKRDGVALASADGCAPGTAEANGVQIGQNSRAGAMLPPNEPFLGAIDRVRLWKRVPQ